MDEWANGKRPKEVKHRFQMQPAAQLLVAPFFNDVGGGEDARVGQIDLFLVAPDAQLDPTDAEYETKLRQVLDNVQNQVGGTWTIEPRELEVFTCEVQKP